MFAPGNAKQVEQSACHRSIVAQALLCCSISFGDHRAPVALAARGRNYRVAEQKGEKKKSGRSKGGGRREPRPRLHPRRPAFTDRPPCLQSKDNAIAVERIPVFDLANTVALSAIVAPKLRLPQPDVLWPPPEQARDERYDEQHQEYEKQYFGDLRGACGDAPESEHRGDQRNDKKYQRIVEHL
jgi:hypothetical protein